MIAYLPPTDCDFYSLFSIKSYNPTFIRYYDNTRFPIGQGFEKNFFKNFAFFLQKYGIFY